MLALPTGVGPDAAPVAAAACPSSSQRSGQNSSARSQLCLEVSSAMKGIHRSVPGARR